MAQSSAARSAPSDHQTIFKRFAACRGRHSGPRQRRSHDLALARASPAPVPCHVPKRDYERAARLWPISTGVSRTWPPRRAYTGTGLHGQGDGPVKP
jgi:hypothetical protein